MCRFAAVRLRQPEANRRHVAVPRVDAKGLNGIG
jgi:hypothetical protein